jgi:hypothetical protein
VTCYDCCRRFKNNLLGKVAFSIGDLLEIKSEGWHELLCNFMDDDGEVKGADGSIATLSMAVLVDDRCKVQVSPPHRACPARP